VGFRYSFVLPRTNENINAGFKSSHLEMILLDKYKNRSIKAYSKVDYDAEVSSLNQDRHRIKFRHHVGLEIASWLALL